MQIALTKKLAQAMGIHSETACPEEEMLFSWTANWIKVWTNRKTEDLLVLVNNAARFTIVIYQVKRKNLKQITKIIPEAIRHTMLSMNLNPVIVEKYMRQAGEIKFVINHNRQRASWVSRAGMESAFYVGNKYNGIDSMYDDTIGISANYQLVHNGGVKSPYFLPYEKMFDLLSDSTGEKIYQYRAFELMVTLDLEIYQATRRIIVPANLTFFDFHQVLQHIFDWDDCHLYEFTILDQKAKPIEYLVPSELDLGYNNQCILMKDHVLEDFLSEHTSMTYTYDMGDFWEHDIKLIRVIDGYDKESPYLIEAKGQTPPEDVGGVGGFMDFYEIMMNPKHPDYKKTKEWAGYWTLELSEWRRQPHVIHL
jgi:hypothetical protein